VHLHQVVNLLLVPIEIRVKFLLIILHHGELSFHFRSITLCLERLRVQLSDPFRVLNQGPVPGCDGLGLLLELLLVLGEIGCPSCDDLVHGLVLQS